MSLLTPTTGERFDRVSIIALKLESGNMAEHLREEMDALLAVPLPPHAAALMGKIVPLVQRLAAVNAFIWHKEDAIRNRPVTDRGRDPMNTMAEIGEMAKEIRTLADRRHQLIAEIDSLFGDPRAGKEKSWMPQDGGAVRGVVPAGAQIGIESAAREAAFPEHTGLPAFCARCGTQPCKVAAARADAPFSKYKRLVHLGELVYCPHCSGQVIQ